MTTFPCLADEIKVQLWFIGQRCNEFGAMEQPQVDFWIKFDDGVWKRFIGRIDMYPQLCMTVAMEWMFADRTKLIADENQLAVCCDPKGEEMTLTELLDRVRNWGK